MAWAQGSQGSDRQGLAKGMAMNQLELLVHIRDTLRRDPNFPDFGSEIELENARMRITIVDTQEHFVIAARPDNSDPLEEMAKVACQNTDNKAFAVKTLRILVSEHLNEDLDIYRAIQLVDAAWEE